MIVNLKHNDVDYQCDLAKPLDISIPLGQVKCFYAPDIELSPYTSGDFVGSVQAGSPVNFYNITLNPHGNGTHTESLGHLTLERESINQCLQQFHFVAQLVSTELTSLKNGDVVISGSDLIGACTLPIPKALIIRTLPNELNKLNIDYSGTNPPYLSREAMQFIVEQGVEHLLIDLPSVDREQDDGKLENHKAFWQLKNNVADETSRIGSTITELIYVPNEIGDGLYLLNIQIPSIHLDAAPSKPVIYQLDSLNQ